MLTYAIRRASHGVILLGVLLVAVFFAIRLVGDPAAQLLPPDASQQDRLAKNKELGLDRSTVAQFGSFVTDFPHSGFGQSIWQHRSAWSAIKERIPASVELGSATFGLVLVIGVGSGLVASYLGRRSVDRLVTSSSFVLISVPSFWLGLVAILLFSVKLGVLPSFGYHGIFKPEYFVLPMVVAAMSPIGRVSQIVRASMEEARSQQYFRVAESKGLTASILLRRHALRPASLSIVTLLGFELARLFGGGLIIIETVFAWPGLGYLTVEAIRKGDFPLVQAAILIQGAVTIATSLLLDILYGFLDPRVRQRQR